MSHALHRHGTAEQLQIDYTFYARASRFVNRDKCGPKLRKILGILLEEKNLVNFGSSHAGKSLKAGLKIEKYATTLDKAYGVAACFSDRESVRSILKKLQEADTGISIVINGLIDEICRIGKEIGLKPHTDFLSLGVHGKRTLLPEDRIQQITTMCGHGLVSSKLSKAVIKRVEAGKMTPEAGADLLAQPCPCGIFNTERCTAILDECRWEVAQETRA
jgi:hypothetical protein